MCTFITVTCRLSFIVSDDSNDTCVCVCPLCVCALAGSQEVFLIGATSSIAAFIKVSIASEVSVSQIPFAGGPRYASRLAVDVATQTVYYPDTDNDAIMGVQIANDTASNRKVSSSISYC
jgi:hypothetical protein